MVRQGTIPVSCIREEGKRPLNISIDQATTDHLLELVMDSAERLNSTLIRGICEKFVYSTHIQSLLYRWMLLMMWEVIRSLVSDF